MEKDEDRDDVVEVDFESERDFCYNKDYPWAPDPDEQRRCYVLSMMMEDASLEAMEQVVEWLKNGLQKPTKPVLKFDNLCGPLKK